MQIVSVDIGSTWTKAALFAREGDALIAVLLPELYTLSAEEYEALHEA